MPCNYEAICEENRKRYGTDIGRIGPMLLSDRYEDRTHFIFELLQNAEDALRKRGDWNGPRRVTFNLSPEWLSLSHFGRPFDEADVRGICGIAESTKDQFSIGRFGIGFKSVYTFTDRPEIHSGEEDFTVANYVQPTRVSPTERAEDETQIILPFKPEDTTAQREITDGFKRLGAGALLFLRHIDEINWNVHGGPSGVYMRSTPENLGPNVHRVTVVGQQSGQEEVDENWLVFHRDVFSPAREEVGRVEVAFSLQPVRDEPGRWSVVPVATSHLVVFFPTAVETNLGFLVQGPYKTTPSRDNISRHEPWNKQLVVQTAELLVDGMRWLRDQEMLDVSALQCLPLDRYKFAEGSMFEPLFTAVRKAMLEEPMLPRFDGGYAEGLRSKLARTQELRELFSPRQVAQLFGTDEAAWLTSEITQDRAPEIRQYVMRELGVIEVTPESVIPRLTQAFLEAQADGWIATFYEFLSGQPGLRRRLDAVPLVRLSDGSHVVARVDGEPQAFLPSDAETGFPTVRKSVCSSLEARSFLTSLGITEPDLVDDVVLNVLEKYRADPVDVDEDQYTTDINRILVAFNTDSKTQREKLLASLRATTFVMVVDAGDRKGYVDAPSNVYLATDRLKLLFEGVPQVMILDDTYPCLRGEDVRELLEACGAMRCPRPVEAPHLLSYDERRELRRKAGHQESSGLKDQIVDWLLQGVDELIHLLPTLSAEERAERARLLWESLRDLEERRGRGVFEGSYKWSHYGSYKTEFPSAFVRQLNAAAWVPDPDGELHPPRLVAFDSLGWKTNPFLLTKIEFKPPIIDQLAKEVGIEPAALDLLRKFGITSVAQLASRLGITETGSETNEAPVTEEPDPDEPTEGENAYGSASGLYGDGVRETTRGRRDPDDSDPDGSRGSGGGASGGGGDGKDGLGTTGIAGHSSGTNRTLVGDARSGQIGGKNGNSTAKRTPGLGGDRPFISYVGTHPDEEGPDPDDLDQVTRMVIENQAIAKVIELEPSLQRTPEGNPGYDLYEADTDGKPVRWVEVKSMTGSLEDRPVGLSRSQFEYARELGTAYWLYIVEYATDADQYRILRIQNPISHARTFTFDRGWAAIARTDPPV